MTGFSLELLRRLQSASSSEAWGEMLSFAWATCSAPVPMEKAASEVSRRDRTLAGVDLFLATAAWDLWELYYESVPRTATELADWWAATGSGRAVLILDALSLRESPWLIEGATRRGYKVHRAAPTCAELPADTNPFAKALGFGQRSALENNGAGNSHALKGARTDSVDLPWLECVDLIDSSKDWVIWHHWPDERIHDLGAPGHGLSALAEEAASQLTSDDFWALIERLTTGRRLVITGDHGYAATGLFPDTADGKQAQHLKSRFKSGRSAPIDGGTRIASFVLAMSRGPSSHSGADSSRIAGPSGRVTKDMLCAMKRAPTRAACRANSSTVR